jgi:phosphatidate cytidylyltransferase
VVGRKDNPMINNFEILRQTIFIYLYIFGIASLLTFICRKTKWGRNMIVAILIWFVIFMLFLFGAYAGWITFSILILLIAYGGVREFYVLNKVYSKATLISAMFFLSFMAWAIAIGNIPLFLIAPCLAVFIMFPVQLISSSYENVIKKVSLQVLGIIYWGWFPLHFLLLRKIEGGFGTIIVLCTMIALNDNSAYYVGKLLGKNSKKLAPKISPNKTWAGLLGGFTATILSAMAFGYALPYFSLLQRLSLGLVTACAIPVGDLIESAMKRDLGVKDSGFLIPGHGGVMDRFDSWVFTAPIVYYFILLLSKMQS